jgi:mono/diheme cytochrome c family protein
MAEVETMPEETLTDLKVTMVGETSADLPIVRGGALRMSDNRWPASAQRFGAIVVMLWLISIPQGMAEDAEAVSAIESGRDRFERNCGICHGIDGKGGGAFSEILKVNPPDLTILSRKNNGSFPFSDVYNAIDGRNTPLAHGREGMPIWGDRYKQSVEGGSETLVRGRILELILYLESLQAY